MVKNCRDPQVRRECIKVLYELESREGMLDSVLVAKIGAWFMNVEEVRMVDGVIPEYARMRLTKMVINVDLKNAELEGLRTTELGEQLVERTVIDWGM